MACAITHVQLVLKVKKDWSCTSTGRHRFLVAAWFSFLYRCYGPKREEVRGDGRELHNMELHVADFARFC